MNKAFQILEKIKNAKNIVIISHVGPDGDTLGSMLALQDLIKQVGMNKKVDTIIMGKKPDIFTFLPNIHEVKNVGHKDLYSAYDLAFSVDCASADRLGEAFELFKNSKSTISFDHHVSNGGFAKIDWVEEKACATGEIIYNFANEVGLQITPEIATNLYTAILTDTGGFKFDNTKPETFEICAQLIRAGVNPCLIYKKCYETKPLSMVKLQAAAVSAATFVADNSIAYTFIDRDLMNKFGATDDHIDGICDILRQISTVNVAFVLKETSKGDTKISFRSVGIDVCEIARFFGGGGHIRAAGCTIQKGLKESLDEILPIIRKKIGK